MPAARGETNDGLKLVPLLERESEMLGLVLAHLLGKERSRKEPS